MTTDNTKTNQRIARYRERQRQRDMVVVRVWVPTQGQRMKGYRPIYRTRRPD
jgi:hypothetical protein